MDIGLISISFYNTDKKGGQIRYWTITGDYFDLKFHEFDLIDKIKYLRSYKNV